MGLSHFSDPFSVYFTRKTLLFTGPIFGGHYEIIDTFQAEIREKGEEKNRLERDIARKNTEIASLKSQLEQSQFEITELRIQMASYKKSMEAKVKKLQATENQRSYEEREVLEATVAELQDQLKALQEAPVVSMDAMRENLLSSVTIHKEIAEQIIDAALSKITYATTPEQQITILTELGRRLQLLEQTGNYVPEDGITPATDQELAYKKNLEAENKRLQEENAAIRKLHEEASKK